MRIGIIAPPWIAVPAPAYGGTEAVLDTPKPIPAAAVRVPAFVPKSEAFVPTVTYSAEVEDIGKLIAYVAANPQFLAFLLPAMPALNAQARALKDAMAIPGVKLVKTSSERSKGK